MKPDRNFRLRNKKEAFVLVGFRYDAMESMEYIQRKLPQPIMEAVGRLLSKNGADVISIRRVYLDTNEELPEVTLHTTEKPQEVLA